MIGADQRCRRGALATAALAILLASACSAPADAKPSRLMKPVCTDSSGTVVADPNRDTIRAFSRDGAQLWSHDQEEGRFAAAAGACATQVFSALIADWTDLTVRDPDPLAYLPNGTTVPWPGRGAHSKFRVLAATGLGTGVVATADGARTTLRTQVDGQFVASEEMKSASFDWAIAPDGRTAAAFDHGTTGGELIILERNHGRWGIASKTEVTEPVYGAFLRDENTYVLAHEDRYDLHTGGTARRIAGPRDVSDVFMAGGNIALLSRMTSVDKDRTDVRVLGPDLRPRFTTSAEQAAVVSAFRNSVVLSFPDRTVVVDGDQHKQLDVPAHRYTFAGQDNTVVQVGPDDVRTKEGL
ncbi:hypothetical protein AOZ06_49905 [Kibdelosporangium phytohabitans]|uniref:Lipoprotein n=2 Tax=Kibdelosporangium phytohabitans TaxID=860235 RepID=A0A0N7F5D4_9PSEU|nr:hypothetical protein AOZ06_49905 [Kibdelosporangium phytohabitans]